MIQIITEKKDWDAQLALFENLDFYHTYDYHCLSKSDTESPVLITYTVGAYVIAIPLLIRDIENSDYKDAISVYGYVGALNLNLDSHFKKEDFHKALNTFFHEHKIVSVFSRLHPFLEEEDAFLKDFGETVELGKIVYIDLTQPLENQKAKYNRRLKTYLNKSRKLCTVINANLDEHLGAFIQLYHDNMRRLGAEDKYFFNDDYYRRILTSDDFEAELKLCVHNDTQTIIGAAIFIKKGHIVQYHLSGLSQDTFDVDPIKLIIDEMRIKATKEGFKYLNLGGGKGSKEDSLFRFKSSFSKDFKTFKIWKHIVDEEAYNTLVNKHFDGVTGIDPDNIHFFPAYRAQIEEMSNHIVK